MARTTTTAAAGAVVMPCATDASKSPPNAVTSAVVSGRRKRRRPTPLTIASRHVAAVVAHVANGATHVVDLARDAPTESAAAWYAVVWSRLTSCPPKSFENPFAR